MRALFGLCGLLLLAAGPVVAEQTDVKATVLWFQEQEPGIEPYPVRVLITDDWLRMDDGQDHGDFLLFDLKEGSIHNVVHGNGSILLIDPGPQEDPETDIETETHRRSMEGSPKVGGRAPEHWVLTVETRVCYQAMVVPGLMQEEAQALGRFAEVLGWQSRLGLDGTPPEMRTPCFMAREILAPDAHWQDGFAIQEWDGEGFRRQLVDFKTGEAVAGSLFDLPQDYQAYSPGG